MTTRMRWLVALATVAAFGAGDAASAADIAAGKAKATEICAACHAADGNSPTQDFPKLGGQYGDYLAKALQEYKNGNRTHPSMRAIAATLSDQDMANLAAYYAQPDVKTAAK